MPAITVSGLASGQNTADIVKKLVELEKRPIQRYEQENQYSKIQIQAWNDLKTLSLELQSKTRNLTSITAGLTSKTIQANKEGYVSGEATKSAKPGKRELNIKKLASGAHITGKQMPKDTVLPGGVFSIQSGKENIEINFSGGSIEEMSSQFSRRVGDFAYVTSVKPTPDTIVMSIKGKKGGKENDFKFEDPSGILRAAGLLEGGSTETFDLGIQPNSQASTASEDKNAVREFLIDTDFTIKPGSRLQVDGKLFGKKEIAVMLQTPTELKKEFKTVTFQNGKAFLPLEEGTLKGVLLKDVSNEEIPKFSVISESGEGKKPHQVVKEAEDAVFTIDGVEITRNTNEYITDVIEGVALNLLKPTEEPIEIDIQKDPNKGMDNIREWVKAYNDLMKYGKDVTSSDKASSSRGILQEKKANEDISAEFWNQKSKTGILAGENNVIRLLGGLKVIIGQAYPGKQFRTLSEIGISTGEIGASWEKIQEGLLVIDEKKLSESLSNSSDEVKALFSYDSNGDSRNEDGVGIKVMEHLKPYVQFPNGVFVTRVKSLEETIASTNKKIKNEETSVLAFEEKLKQKFLYMEQGVGKNKSVGTYLQQNYFNKGQN